MQLYTRNYNEFFYFNLSVSGTKMHRFSITRKAQLRF